MNLTLEDMKFILEVYGEVPKAPKGYEFTGELRESKNGEWWLGNEWWQDTIAPLFNNYQHRRLILRKLPEPPKVYTTTLATTDIYPKGYEIPEGYEYVAFTLTEYADGLGATHALDSYGNLSFPGDYFPNSPRILLKKKA